MRRLGRMVLGFVAGAIVVGLGSGIAVFTIGDLMGVSQAEGAFAMGVAFTLVPLAGLVGGVIGAIWLGRKRSAPPEA